MHQDFRFCAQPFCPLDSDVGLTVQEVVGFFTRRGSGCRRAVSHWRGPGAVLAPLWPPPVHVGDRHDAFVGRGGPANLCDRRRNRRDDMHEAMRGSVVVLVGSPVISGLSSEGPSGGSSQDGSAWKAIWQPLVMASPAARAAWLERRTPPVGNLDPNSRYARSR